MQSLTQLIQIGLSENEARVYLAALELGSATAQQIAQKAEINRPTAYVQIDTLMELGLMNSHMVGKKRLFGAESPDQLRELLKKREVHIKEQKNYLKEILPELQSLFLTTKERPKVRFYEGKEGILAMSKDIFGTSTKEILSIYPFDLYNVVFSESERREFEKIRKRRKIKGNALYTRKEGVFKTPAPPTIRDRYIPSDAFPVTAGIDIYNNKIAAFALRGKLVGVIIESNEITNTLRSIFHLAWEGAEKYQK